LTYGSDAAQTHLSNAFWYLDTGNLLPCDPTVAVTATTNTGYVTRWNRLKQSKAIELYGRVHSVICNVAQYLIPGVGLQIRFTKANENFFLMNKDAASKTTFKFLEAKLLVNRIRSSPTQLLAHNTALSKGCIARYNITRVELKTSTFASGTQSLSIDNAIIGQLPNRILITMVNNKDFLGSVTSNPYNFRHYKLSNFAMYLNGKHIPSEGQSVDFGHEKSSVVAYRTLFTGSGIHHSVDHKISHMYINGFFMLLFDLTPDHAASGGHVSKPDDGHIRLEFKFTEPLPETLNCLLYLEFDSSVRINALRSVTTDY
jgi:hypothetical protein